MVSHIDCKDELHSAYIKVERFNLHNTMRDMLIRQAEAAEHSEQRIEAFRLYIIQQAP